MKFKINKLGVLSKITPAVIGAAGAGLTGYLHADGLDPEDVSGLTQTADTSAEQLNQSENRLSDLQNASIRSLEQYQTLRGTGNLSPEQLQQVQQLGNVAKNDSALLDTANNQIDKIRTTDNINQDHLSQAQLHHDDRVNGFTKRMAIEGGLAGAGATAIGAMMSKNKNKK